jgi:glycosyltransferase involved in cell wall biosynthesis
MDIEQALRKTLFAIPSINGGRLLDRMLPTLRVPTDIVVVLDQGSTDDTEEVCRSAGVKLVQLGRPHTYTQACNLAARMAADRGADFVYVANNDITFQTDVARQLFAAMMDDPNLAICAPTQFLIDNAVGFRRLVYRAAWDLKNLDFFHDFAPPRGNPVRYESDFCELTCAIIRLKAAQEIGFLDDKYGYFEDADFGYRLRMAGYSAAYIPAAQIDHYSSSTFSRELKERKDVYVANNRWLFAEKHLGFGVNHDDLVPAGATSWEIINQNLHPILQRMGLLDSARPELIFAHAGAAPFDYLYTVWETTKLPHEWLARLGRYKAIMVASLWNKQVFADAGFVDVFHVPLGVDTDIFMPSGVSERPSVETTFLWFARNQHRKGLDVMLRAWTDFRRRNSSARLIILGEFVRGALIHVPVSVRRWKNLIIEDYADDRISVWETMEPLTADDLAALYRSVDFVVSTARSEGFGFVVAEAMACGTVPIFPAYGATGEFAFGDALTLRGNEARADYSDKGFGDVGNWWEPDAGHLTELLHEACTMDPEARRILSARAVKKITGNYTWRHTGFAIARALRTLQNPALKAADRAPSPLAQMQASRPQLAWLKRGPAVYDAKAAPVWLPKPSPVHRAGVLCVGYLEAALGLGQSFRDLLTSMEGMSIPFSVYPFNVNVENRRIGPFMEERYDNEGRYDVNLIQTAPDQLPYAIRELGPLRTTGTYNILRAFWELPRAPREWGVILRDVHEIWAPNDFVAAAFRECFHGPIINVPEPVLVDRMQTFDRSHFGMREGRFYFLFSFDYFSFPARKNPLAVLRAFQAAFPSNAQNAGLIIKSIGPTEIASDVGREIAAAAAADSRICVIDAPMSRDEMLSLIECADCYVSLHRSEGFGLGMAEAMLLRRPVIGTNFSGNTAFLSDETGFPAAFAMVPVRAGEYPFHEGQYWAEPDQADAIRLMRLVIDSPAERERRAVNANAFMATYHAAKTVQLTVEGRLSDILAERVRRDTSHRSRASSEAQWTGVVTRPA